MSHIWSNNVEEATRVVEQIAKSIDEGIQVFGNGGKGIQNDTFETVLVKGERKRRVIVSFEDIVNAKANSADLEEQLRKVWEAKPTKEGKGEHS